MRKNDIDFMDGLGGESFTKHDTPREQTFDSKDAERKYDEFIQKGLKKESSPGYAQRKDGREYSENDYGNTHYTDNKTDYQYDLARLMFQGMAERQREDEELERMRYRMRHRYGYYDDDGEINKTLFAYIIGALCGIAFARLLNTDYLGYIIFAFIFTGIGGTVKSHALDEIPLGRAILRNFAVTALLAVVVAIAAAVSYAS